MNNTNDLVDKKVDKVVNQMVDRKKLSTKRLTRTEEEILRLIVDEGMDSKGIEELRGCSRQAISKYIQRIRAKGYSDLVDKKVDKVVNHLVDRPSPTLSSGGMRKRSLGVLENSKSEDRASEGVKEQVRKIAMPIFEKVLQETSSSSMTTMVDNLPEALKFFWRPNNYRRQISVKRKNSSRIKLIINELRKRGCTARNNSTIDGCQPKQGGRLQERGCTTRNNSTNSGFCDSESAIDSTGKGLIVSYNKHTKIISVKNYRGITIQYGADTLTGIYSQNVIGGVKEIFLIEAYNIDDLDKRISQKRDKIITQIDDALDAFCREFNIGLPFETPDWSRYEDFIKGEDFIDKIPAEVIIHDTTFKKVYGKGIEFKNSQPDEVPGVALKNYISNRAIEGIAPQIAESLNALHASIEQSNSDVANNVTIVSDMVVSLASMCVKINTANAETAIHHKETASGLNGLTKFLSSQLPKEQEIVPEEKGRIDYCG